MISKKMDQTRMYKYAAEIFICEHCNTAFDINLVTKDFQVVQVLQIDFCPFCGEKLE